MFISNHVWIFMVFRWCSGVCCGWGPKQPQSENAMSATHQANILTWDSCSSSPLSFLIQTILVHWWYSSCQGGWVWGACTGKPWTDAAEFERWTFAPKPLGAIQPVICLKEVSSSTPWRRQGDKSLKESKSLGIWYFLGTQSKWLWAVVLLDGRGSKKKWVLRSDEVGHV